MSQRYLSSSWFSVESKYYVCNAIALAYPFNKSDVFIVVVGKWGVFNMPYIV